MSKGQYVNIYCTNAYNDHDLLSQFKETCIVEVLTSTIVIQQPVCLLLKFPFWVRTFVLVLVLVDPPLSTVDREVNSCWGHGGNQTTKLKSLVIFHKNSMATDVVTRTNIDDAFGSIHPFSISALGTQGCWSLTQVS